MHTKVLCPFQPGDHVYRDFKVGNIVSCKHHGIVMEVLVRKTEAVAGEIAEVRIVIMDFSGTLEDQPNRSSASSNFFLSGKGSSYKGRSLFSPGKGSNSFPSDKGRSSFASDTGSGLSAIPKSI